MTTTTVSDHVPALGTHERAETGTELQATLIELIALSLIGKQMHWSIVGPRFRELHLYLDELVDSWRELSDTVAERAVALGFSPDGQAEAVAATSAVPQLKVGLVEDRAVVQELVRRVGDVAERTRVRMDRLGEIDAASQDVLVEVVRALEEQLWMIRSQLS
jgi:starvation-inducible DNA-binding protein